MLSAVFEVVVGLQGPGIIRPGYDILELLRSRSSFYRASVFEVDTGEYGEAPPNAIFDPKFSPHPLFSKPTQAHR